MSLIVQLKREQPDWGAPKIREKLRRRYSGIQTPAISTVHAVLDRHGLVKHGRKPRYQAQGTTLSRPLVPNDLWPPSLPHKTCCSSRPGSTTFSSAFGMREMAIPIDVVIEKEVKQRAAA